MPGGRARRYPPRTLARSVRRAAPRRWVPTNNRRVPTIGADELVSEQADEYKGTDAQHGIVRSVRPGVPMPATVLVCQMGDGALFLHGRRDGPNAYVCADDVALLQELAAAFGSAPGNDTMATS